MSRPQRRGARATETRKPLLDVVAVQPFSSFSAVSRRFLALTIVFSGCAKRGTGGTLNPQSAIVGLNSGPRSRRSAPDPRKWR